jgi:hypothetical protein
MGFFSSENGTTKITFRQGAAVGRPAEDGIHEILDETELHRNRHVLLDFIQIPVDGAGEHERQSLVGTDSADCAIGSLVQVDAMAS